VPDIEKAFFEMEDTVCMLFKSICMHMAASVWARPFLSSKIKTGGSIWKPELPLSE
jgi:hypothetical protein